MAAIEDQEYKQREEWDPGIPLFPSAFRWVGIPMALAGLAFAYLYFLGGKPRIFEMKVFAVVTAYLETRYFVIAQTNVLDELASLFFIGGVCLIAFSKERIEEPWFRMLRLRSLIISLYFVLGLGLTAYLLIYGWVIFWVLSGLIPLYMLIYYASFRILVWRRRRMLMN